ncbi:MAG: hypothetical protein ACQEQZ_04410 [Pseudomonadota bacterium]
MKPTSRITDATAIAWIVRVLTMSFLISGQAVAKQTDPDAVRIVENAQQHYEDSISHIDDMEVVTDKHINYYKKVEQNGHSYLEFVGQDTRSDKAMNARASESGYSLLTPSVFADLKENARYQGKDVVNGHPVHILYVDKLVIPAKEPGTNETAEDARLYIDSDDWILRQVSFTTEIERENGRKQMVDSVSILKDYRNVDGMMIAFKTVTQMTGVSDMLTAEERKEAEQAIKELEKLPAEQREMAERMMGNKISKYKKMLENDRMETVQEIEEVRVNTGG